MKTMMITMLAILASSAGVDVFAQPEPTFSARSEVTLGLFDPKSDDPWILSNASSADGEWRAHRDSSWTNIRGGLWKKAAAKFLIEGDDVPVAVIFSAEAYVQDADRRLFVRLLVDGQRMNPHDVVFATGPSDVTAEWAARSFEFTGTYDSGLHTLEAQWYVDPGASAYIRDIALLIRQGDRNDLEGTLVPVTPSSGLNLGTSGTTWRDVPGLQSQIYIPFLKKQLTVTVSAEAYASPQKNAWLRVLIDGAVAHPGPVRFATSGYDGTRTMAFALDDVSPGLHDVKVQWRADSGGSAGMGDRTMTVFVGNPDEFPIQQHFRYGQNQYQAPTDWEVVNGLSVFPVPLAENSDISVVFTAAFPKDVDAPLYARLVVGGEPVENSTVMLTNGGTNEGVYSFTFDAKRLHEALTSVEIEWKTASNDNPPPYIDERSMIVYVKPHSVPDLAESPPFGLGYSSGNSTGNFPVEPMRGQQDVLVILFDPHRPGQPAPSIASLTTALFGPVNSLADYFDEVSGGRFGIRNAGVLGPYDAAHDWTYYWSGQPGRHQDKWKEAILAADNDFDFSEYDFDGDGYISGWNELSVLIVVPGTGSSGFVRQAWDGETPQTVDGVFVDFISEWYVSNPTQFFYLAGHEIGHLVLSVSDLYRKSKSALRINTEPGAYCLMDLSTLASSSHFNPEYKLGLGWVTPRILTGNSDVTLTDVKLGDHDVVVLPRDVGGSGDEYIIVENRRPWGYDSALADDGLGVWHIIEALADNQTPPAPCNTNGNWQAQTQSDSPRAGIRLIRPATSFNDVSALWSDEDYDLDGDGLDCDGGQNVLLWSDLSSSYELTDFSAPGVSMTFSVGAPPETVRPGAADLLTETIEAEMDDRGSLDMPQWRGSTPNPVTNRATIRFSVPRAGDAILNIYDPTGRLVRSMRSQDLTAGTHDFVWNARDRQGHVVTNGVYFYSVTAGATLLTQGKLMVLR